MDTNILQALTALSDKLGTTPEYLWSALIKQAPISGATTLALIAAALLFTTFWFIFVAIKSRRLYEDTLIFAWLSVFVMVVVTTAIILFHLPIAISGLTNPEYWALKQILNAAR